MKTIRGESNGKCAEPEPASVFDKHRAAMISTAALNTRRTHVLEVALIASLAALLLAVVGLMNRPGPTYRFIVLNGHRISEPVAELAATPDDRAWIAGEFVTLFRTQVFPDRTRSFLLAGSPVVGIVKTWDDAMASGGFRVLNVSLQQTTKVSDDAWEVDWLETRDHDQGAYEMKAIVTLAFTPSDPILPENPWGAHITKLFVFKEAKVR